MRPKETRILAYSTYNENEQTLALAFFQFSKDYKLFGVYQVAEIHWTMLINLLLSRAAIDSSNIMSTKRI